MFDLLSRNLVVDGGPARRMCPAARPRDDHLAGCDPGNLGPVLRDLRDRRWPAGAGGAVRAGADRPSPDGGFLTTYRRHPVTNRVGAQNITEHKRAEA